MTDRGPELSSPHFVIFDFDRTLGQLFSDADASRAAQKIVREMSDDRLRPADDPYAIWGGVRLALRSTVGLAERLSLEELELACRILLRREEFSQIERAVLYPHTRHVIRRLFSSDISLGVVSNNDEEVVSQLLERWGIRRFFRTVVGRSPDTPVNVLKPSPAPLLSAIGSLHEGNAPGLYVGDSVEDAICATAASVPFVAVTTGRASASDFRAYAPRATIDDLDALLTLISS